MPSDVFSLILQGGTGRIKQHYHSNEGVTLVLSNLARLYGHGDSDSESLARSRRDMAASRKLGYHAVRVLWVPTTTLRVPADEVLA